MFKVLSSTPLHLEHTALAIETAKAGSIALFDLEFCENSDIEQAIINLNYTLSVLKEDSSIGLRVPWDKLSHFKPVIKLLSGNSYILVISGLKSNEFSDGKIPDWIKELELQVWAELTSILQISILENLNFSAFVLKGNESGGQTGEESSFILASHLIKNSKRPCYIQGGIGIHTAAACYAAGAEGVIIDDHLLGMDRSPFLLQWKGALKRLALENTKTISVDGKLTRTVDHPLFKNASRIGWGNPSEFKWPCGQMIGRSEETANKYKTVGRFIKAIRSNVELNIAAAKKLEPLAPLSKMAKANGTHYPIVQGPMTRVSDVPDFVNSVASSGGLPFLALSMTSGNAVPELLQKTKTKLDDKPWGVGVLGFVPEDLRVHQFKEIKKVKPPFALISGGTVSQIHEFEEVGIKTFVHVPAPSLLKIYLDKGCKRFVFEGRECGGHVGPIGSFSLWEAMINILLNIPKKEAEEIEVLFAGGIYNDISASMLAAMSGQLVDHGVKIGALMGTAYLFTKEVCDSGAILPKFQKTAIDCAKTAIIEVSPGHAIRCANTPFVNEFNLEKQKGNQELEKLTLGRLRIASKGLQRNKHGSIVSISENDQYDSGMYMLGEVAGLVSGLTKMKTLHEKVCKGGNKLLQNVELKEKKIQKRKASNIAIIGISTLLPKADSPGKFWTNIINKVNAITEIPPERWDWNLYYDQDKTKKDKIYSKWGGFIDDIIFDPLKFGIPPHSLKFISPGQLLLIEAVDRALKDAGYENGGFDNENTSVIVGSDGMSTLKTQYTVRSISPLTIDLLTDEDLERLPEWNEESFPGILTNLLAGRIANRFNLGGSNFTIDAACASSLTAIDIAIKELEHGNSNLVIAAGADIAQSPFSYTAFSKTQALSPTGTSKPFSKKANGIVISEGVAVVMLKRLEDAERDGDKIYGVIKGAASSSDGKGLGLTAPRSGGQKKAIYRAYEKAGFAPSTIGTYEAHGTGTSVGDKVELSSINGVLEKTSARENSCAVGSVKSLIGHTKTTAGIVGLIKSTLSLYYQTIAPHPMDDEPLDLITQKESPLYLLEKARPWFKNDSNPRRAGVSAFGFGGTNTHITIEEYRNNNKKEVLGNEHWPVELFFWQSDSKEELLEKILLWEKTLKKEISISLKDLSFVSYNETQTTGNQKIKLCIVADSIENLTSLLQRLIKKLKHDENLALPPQILINFDSTKKAGKLAFVFPGQGSQYINMGLESSLYFSEIREAIELTNKKLNRELTLDKLIFPEASFNKEKSHYHNQRLKATQNAQPAIGAISLGYFNLLKALHVNPEAVAGHSYGEFTALYAAGVVSLNDFIHISDMRGKLMASGCEVDGTMAVVSLTSEEIIPYLKESVFVANLNAPKQVVISGEKKALKDVLKNIQKDGHIAREISVAGPFHTPYFKLSQQPLEEVIKALDLKPPKIRLYSNTNAKVYPKHSNQIGELLNKHLLSPVLFSQEIEQMYDDGFRFFVEVGPKKVLTGLIDKILEGKSYKAIAIEAQGGGIKGVLTSIGSLYTSGYKLNLERIYEGRNCQFLSLSEVVKASSQVKYSKASVLLHGGGVRGFEEIKANSANSDFIDSSSRKEIKSINELQLSQNSNPLNKNETLLKGYKAYQETMQKFLASQETMMSHFLNEETFPEPNFDYHSSELFQKKANSLSNIDSASKEEPSKLTSEKEIETSPSTTDYNKLDGREEFLNSMIEIISERTGYPIDMLNKDIDLEAELGIDSIKRMEVLDKVLQLLPTQHEEVLKPMMSKLMRTKTIDDFLKIVFADEVLKALPQDTRTSKEEGTKSLNRDVNNNKTCARYVMKSVFHELPYNKDVKLEGVHIITSDNGNVAKLVAQKISKLGGIPIVFDEEELASFERLEEKMSTILNGYPEISSIVHCSPLSEVAMPEALSQWKYLTQVQSKSLFQLLRHAAVNQRSNEGFSVKKVLTTSSFGGYFGRKHNTSHGLPSSGGNSGMLKALKKEKPELDIKIVDFDNSLLESEIAYRIIRELKFTSEFTEIGYPKGERAIFHPIAAEINEEENVKSSLLDKNAVVLATGAAKGITAEISKSLMIPGMKLIIVGRSKDIELEAVPDGGTNMSFQQLIDKGIEIKYFSVDVRDSHALKTLIDNIYATYGRLDAVLHGAGIIEDDHIDQKNLDSFDTVFDTKVDTAFLLYKYLQPESLKLLVFFGSVSGRFGNQGQTDYATANEVLNRFAWYLHQNWKKTRTITINWGPWNSIGMASPMVLRLLESQGMKPINPEEGCNFFLREIYLEHDETSEVIAGEGPWANLEDVVIPELEFEHIFNQTEIPSIF
jgi:acyl transferase domain-containing protein/NAD(P)H-dependent flavin oxidoreductase YrpB (nitropropane dioxygenase family)